MIVCCVGLLKQSEPPLFFCWYYVLCGFGHKDCNIVSRLLYDLLSFLHIFPYTVMGCGVVNAEIKVCLC